MKTVFAGYDPKGRPVTAAIDDIGRLWVTDTITGESVRFNEEYYTEDFNFSFLFAYEGYRK